MGHSRRALTGSGVLAVLLWACLCPVAMAATSADSTHTFFSFRPQSWPHTRVFPVIELAFIRQFDASADHVLVDEVGVDLGLMVNTGDRTAWGLSFNVTTNYFERKGLRLRYRHWLARRTAFDVSPGVWSDQGDWDGNRHTGLSGRLGLLHTDIGGIFLGAESGTMFEDRTGIERDGLHWNAGLETGTYTSLAAGLVYGVLIVIFIIAWSGNYD